MPAFSTRFIDDERDRLREQGSLARSGMIDRSGALPADLNVSTMGPGASQGSPQRGALINAAQPSQPTGQATTGYPPDPSAQASSPGLAGAAPPYGGSFKGGIGPKSGNGSGSFKGGKVPQNTTKDLFKGTNPLDIEDAMSASLAAMDNTAKTNPDAFKMTEASLVLKGIDIPAAFMDMKNNLMDAAAERKGGRGSKTYNETEFKKRWKNVFNIIPRERMGLFLFDFGLRMLAASSMPGGAGSHAGMAGMGALQGMQGQQQQEEENALATEKQASEEAGALIGLEQDERQIGIQDREATTREQARIGEEAYRTESNRLEGEKIEVDRMRARAGLTSSGERNEFSHENLSKMYQRVGYSEREAADLIAGAKTEAEIRFAVAQAFNDDKTDRFVKDIPPGGTEPKRLVDFTQKERMAYIDQMVNYMRFGSGGGGAQQPQRPKDMDDPKYSTK